MYESVFLIDSNTFEVTYCLNIFASGFREFNNKQLIKIILGCQFFGISSSVFEFELLNFFSKIREL